MTRQAFALPLTLFLVSHAVGVQAQSLPSIPGAGSIMKGGLPSLSSMGAGNAAGVLGYCVKNKYLSGTDPTQVLNTLSKKPGVTSSSGYTAGKAGNIVTGKGQSFSLDKVQGDMKSKACGMVLKQAKTLI